MTDGKNLCVLTVHGIGFQQPPTDSAAGYADVLHENLGAGFSWGNNCGGLQSTTWLNFWDEKDPVADPLSPPNSWHYGSAPDSPPPGELGLFYALDDDGNQVTVTDIEVNNLEKSSGGGPQAHNYWDNNEQFITELAKLLKTTAA